MVANPDNLAPVNEKDKERVKLTYSLNPNVNKRIKTKRIEDLRKQAVDNVKKSMSMLESTGTVGFFGQKGQNFRDDPIIPPRSIAVEKSDQKYRKKMSSTITSREHHHSKKVSLLGGGSNGKFNTSVLFPPYDQM